jgi:catechol 2,3-dioxygenase-like lactoylglutathione lyase family enzyme
MPHTDVRRLLLMTLGVTLAVAAAGHLAATDRVPQPTPVQLETIALRVNRMDAMVAFYTEAFGARFRQVPAGGMTMQYGVVAGVTFKFMPIRPGVDFEGATIHQLGFDVTSVEHVLSAARRNGGRLEGDVTSDQRMIRGTVRDPDGNTIELYQLR